MDDISAVQAQSNSALPSIGGIKTKEAARKVAEEFEAMFIAQMLAPMFEALETDGPTGGGAAERAFRPMLVNEYANEMTKQGGVGIADQVYGEILRMQGLGDAPES